MGRQSLETTALLLQEKHGVHVEGPSGRSWAKAIPPLCNRSLSHHSVMTESGGVLHGKQQLKSTESEQLRVDTDRMEDLIMESRQAKAQSDEGHGSAMVTL